MDPTESSVIETPFEAALSERYLVYACALGVSEHLAKALAMRIPEEQQSTFAPWYIGGSDGRHFSGMADFGSSKSRMRSSSSSRWMPGIE